MTPTKWDAFGDELVHIIKDDSVKVTLKQQAWSDKPVTEAFLEKNASVKTASVAELIRRTFAK